MIRQTRQMTPKIQRRKPKVRFQFSFWRSFVCLADKSSVAAEPRCEIRGSPIFPRTSLPRFRRNNKRTKTASRYHEELLSISVLVWARECMAGIQSDLSHGRNAGASTKIDATLAILLAVVVPAAF